ncbi:MAG: tRNA (guanosine(37)-N1)-methyltransferase TrmD, partial [Candidatus Marinimicrobia bacterium]|nr:tRNA (guanosine(37)-N1)-methyltransferase TrmD [Candidatus Neomarinimicrobiota bacterium]
DQLVTHEYSIGDFVVTGGELPALLMIDAAVRLKAGVLNSQESAELDSFSHQLLDGPHYTRPREYRGLTVPEILLSGDHGEIAKWRRAQREASTREKRPDIWESHESRQDN